MVLRGIGRLDMGLATVGGLGIVLLAIVLDRITQAMGEPRRGGPLVAPAGRWACCCASARTIKTIAIRA